MRKRKAEDGMPVRWPWAIRPERETETGQLTGKLQVDPDHAYWSSWPRKYPDTSGAAKETIKPRFICSTCKGSGRYTPLGAKKSAQCHKCSGEGWRDGPSTVCAFCAGQGLSSGVDLDGKPFIRACEWCTGLGAVADDSGWADVRAGIK